MVNVNSGFEFSPRHTSIQDGLDSLAGTDAKGEGEATYVATNCTNCLFLFLLSLWTFLYSLIEMLPRGYHGIAADQP